MDQHKRTDSTSLQDQAQAPEARATAPVASVARTRMAVTGRAGEPTYGSSRRQLHLWIDATGDFELRHMASLRGQTLSGAVQYLINKETRALRKPS